MYKNLKRYYKPPIFIGGFFIYSIMKNIKTYKIFESKDLDKSLSNLSDAKEAVEQSLLELTDNGYKVEMFNDRFNSDDKGRCFSVIITKESKESRGGLHSQIPFNFQDVIDDIWHSFNIPSDYGFHFFAMPINLTKGGMKIIWNPLEAKNLEEVLEGLEKVQSVSLSFIEKDKFQDKIESGFDRQRDSLKDSIPGLEY